MLVLAAAIGLVAAQPRFSCFPMGVEPTKEQLVQWTEVMESEGRFDLPPRNLTNYIVAEYMVPMRDGVSLFTEVILPVGATSVGAVLERTTYGARADTKWVQLGFAAVAQDMRGCWKSEGEFAMWRTCGKDGYDTMEWIAAQPWSNGKVFSEGASASGNSAYAQIAESPSWLKAAYVRVASSDGHSTGYIGGAYRSELNDAWLSAISPPAIPELRENEAEGPWWDSLRGEDFFSLIAGPGVHEAGWFDIFQQGTIDAFMAGQYLGDPAWRGTHYLVVGSNGHCGRTYFPNPSSDLPEALAIEMFLEQNSTPENPYRSDLLAETPAITWYVMGPDIRTALGNYWTDAEEWPEQTEMSLYLQSDKQLNTTLSLFHSTLALVYNPADPVRTVGGNNLFADCGPSEQSEVEARPDVLVFTTEALSEAVCVTGRVSGVLFVETSANDTDWTMRLTDVYPNGESHLVSDSAVRMKWAQDETTPINPIPGQIYELNFDLWSTSYIFNAGHRIRVQVSSSNSRRILPNPNNGLLLVEDGDEFVANNIVHFSSTHPSRITLPVVDLADVAPSARAQRFAR